MERFPVLKTQRLLLREFHEDDAQALFEILSDVQVNRFLPMFPLASLPQAKAYLKAHYLGNPDGWHYAVCLREEGAPVGYLHVSGQDSHDLGYGLHKDYWHRGIMTEACRAVVEMLKCTDLPYITATHDVNNPRSGAIMRKLGMTYRYSYVEQWQPKNFPVTFRMYQLNLDGREGRVYRKYWEQYPEHFIEENL